MGRGTTQDCNFVELKNFVIRIKCSFVFGDVLCTDLWVDHDGFCLARRIFSRRPWLFYIQFIFKCKINRSFTPRPFLNVVLYITPALGSPRGEVRSMDLSLSKGCRAPRSQGTAVGEAANEPGARNMQYTNQYLSDLYRHRGTRVVMNLKKQNGAKMFYMKVVVLYMSIDIVGSEVRSAYPTCTR